MTYTNWRKAIDATRTVAINDKWLVIVDIGDGPLTYSPQSYWPTMRLILFLLYQHTFWNIGRPIRKLRAKYNV